MRFCQYGSFFIGESIALFISTFTLAQESALIADNQTGHILYNSNIEHRLQIGSLATIATAVVTLDWAYVNRITPSAQAIVPSSSAFNSILRPGDQISLRDLIYCTILSSDCGAAHTLADYIGSRVQNPMGLSAERNFLSTESLGATGLPHGKLRASAGPDSIGMVISQSEGRKCFCRKCFARERTYAASHQRKIGG